MKMLKSENIDIRFAMIFNYGLYSLQGNGRNGLKWDTIGKEEYDCCCNLFKYKFNSCYYWVKTAYNAGVDLVILNAKHHDGYALWNSKEVEFNCVNYGIHRDLVCDFISECQKYKIKSGLSISLFDLKNNDCLKSSIDNDAKTKYLNYLYNVNKEIIINNPELNYLFLELPSFVDWIKYEDIDLLIKELEKINSNIIIVNNSKNSYFTKINELKDNEVSKKEIIDDLLCCTRNNGKYLLSIDLKPSGEVFKTTEKSLLEIGSWLKLNKEAIWGDRDNISVFDDEYERSRMCNQSDISIKDKYIYITVKENYDNKIVISGFNESPVNVYCLSLQKEVEFIVYRNKIIIRTDNISLKDELGYITLRLQFNNKPQYVSFSNSIKELLLTNKL